MIEQTQFPFMKPIKKTSNIGWLWFGAIAIVGTGLTIYLVNKRKSFKHETR